MIKDNNILNIIKHVDHTLLTQRAGIAQIMNLCREAQAYSAASVCIPPSYVKAVSKLWASKIKICTVIGFPNGYSTKETKLFETADALNNGSDEIDMVINLGDVENKEFIKIEDEIKAVKKVCGDKILKVIIETCLLNEAEKIEMCKCVTSSGADYIKTSTGFSSSGAAANDIILFKKHIGKNVKIKAAGGINTLEAAKEFLSLGADRLGSSRLIRLAME